MQIVPILILIILLAAIVIVGTLNLPSPPLKKLRYRHPENALGVGPVWTEEQGPPLHYMWIWRDGERLKMEFRNMPGVEMIFDYRVVGELSESLKKLVDTEENVG